MTLEQIAAELGMGVTTVRRVLESALAKLRDGLDPDLDLETFSGEITSDYEIARQFSAIAVDGDRAPRASSSPKETRPSPPSPGVGGDQRTGHLPRRFRRRSP